MSLKITNPDIRGQQVPRGDLDQPGSPWAGMSGAVVVTAEDLMVGVIRGHSPAEGTGSLTATRLEAVTSLPHDVAGLFLDAMQVPDSRQWLTVPSIWGSVVVAPGQMVVGEILRKPPGFVERETLARLAEAAAPGEVAVVYAVTGLRGVGKTQLAAAYARERVAQRWGLVGWVNAETPDTLLAGLARIADRLGVADPDGDSLESARRLKEHLQTRAGAGLLVFDNATDPDGLRPLLPATGSTQVVITTTDQAFTEFGRSVDVAAFSRPESVSYLAERTGLADQDSAAAVADELGDLPLALAQAAATIRRQHLTYPKYLQRLARVSVQRLLGQVPGGDYPRSAAAALLLSIQATEDSDPTGLTGRLLRVLAVLSADGVRRDLLDGLPTEPSPEAGEVDAALERCVAGSLLTWSVTGDAVIMHRLLGRVLRERDQADGQWATTISAALDLLEPLRLPPEQAWARREDVAHLVAQVEALHEADASGLSGPDLRLRQLQARSWAARQLRETADLSRAIHLGAQVLAESERVLGADHPDTLTARNGLASAYRAAGRLGEAIPLFEQAMVGYRRVLGPDHPWTLISQNNFAGAYREAGRLSEAISLYEQNLADRERVLGADHLSTLTTRNNLAYAYLDAGRLGEAIPLQEQVLAEFERVLGADHPDTLTVRNNLGGAYQAAGRLDEAIPLYEQNLAVSERMLGADHPTILVVRNNLAGAFKDAGRLGEAIPLYEQNLAEFERVLGADDPRTLTAQNNLASAYQEAGRLGEAIPLVEQNLVDHERVLGADHPSTLTTRNNLAYGYRRARRLDEAIPLYEQNLAESERVLGADHPDTLSARHSLASAYQEAGRLGKAIPLFEQSLADRERVLGADHPDTLSTRNGLDRARTEAHPD
jgi:tetratricopeptide (TPR) repeat protein